AAAKARGVVLGNPANLSLQDVGAARGTASRVRRADARAADLASIVEELRAEGYTSLRQIAAGLTSRGIKTARGRDWTATAVRNLLARQGTRAIRQDLLVVA